MLKRASPVVSLTLLYCAGYFAAGPFARAAPLSAAEGAAAFLAAAGALVVVVSTALTLRRGAATRSLWIALTLLCFFLCGLARGAYSESLRYIIRRRLAAFDGAAWDGGLTGGDGPGGGGGGGPAGGVRSGRPASTIAVGVVSGFPSELNEGSRFVLELWAAKRGGHADSWDRDRPRVLVTVRPAADIRHGDLLRIEGKLALATGARNPGGFDYEAYLSSMGLHATFSAGAAHVRLIGEGYGVSVLTRTVGPIRRGIGGLIDRRLEGEAKALLRGLLLGDRSLLERDLSESMARAGVIHIMAVSGMNVALLAVVLIGAARCVGASGPAAELTSVVGAITYCALVGFPPSACRAGSMLAAFVVFRRLQRPGAAYDSLSAAGFALSLAHPEWVAGPGFQLSFAAAAGVLAFNNRLMRLAEGTALCRVPGAKGAVSLGEASLGASIATWPLVAFHFGRTPLLFMVGNAFAVPLVGVIMTWGLAGVFVGALSGTLCDLMLAACWAAARVLTWGCRLIGSIPWASADVGSFSPFLIPAYFVAVVWAGSARGRLRGAAVAAACAVSLLICLGSPRSGGKERLEVAFLDVGHGDASVMLTPTGECMLVDAGAATPHWNAGRDVVAPYLRARGVRRIDRVVISHGDGDHWGGLEEVSRSLHVREIVLPRCVPLGELAHLVPRLEARGAAVRWVEAGDTLEPLGGLQCVVLHPSQEFESRFGAGMGDRLNDRSLVLRVAYGSAVFLMAGDVEETAENWLVATGAPLECTVLKVPHHGSDSSSGVDFVRRASPLIAVISCGPRELFNLPKPDVIARYDSLGVELTLTVRDGAMIMQTDGASLLARPFLNPEASANLELGARR